MRLIGILCSLEIDSIGDSQKLAIENLSDRLIQYILKLRYWNTEPDRERRHWRSQVISLRFKIKRIIKRNPSLEDYPAEVYPEICQDAVEVVKCLFEVPENSKPVVPRNHE